MQFPVLAPRSCCGTRTESCEILRVVPSIPVDGAHAVHLRKLVSLETSRRAWGKQNRLQEADATGDQNSQGLMIHCVKYTLSPDCRIEPRIHQCQCSFVFNQFLWHLRATTSFLSLTGWSTDETVTYYFLLLATPIGQVTEIGILDVDDDPCGNQSLLSNRFPFCFGFILKFSKSTLSKLR